MPFKDRRWQRLEKGLGKGKACVQVLELTLMSELHREIVEDAKVGTSACRVRSGSWKSFDSFIF